MTTYSAISIVEGFSAVPPTRESYFKAWSHLIKSGDVWTLQGYYGRSANDYINAGIIDQDGTINWDNIDEYYNQSL